LQVAKTCKNGKNKGHCIYSVAKTKWSEHDATNDDIYSTVEFFTASWKYFTSVNIAALQLNNASECAKVSL